MINILTIFFLIIRIVSNPIANLFQKKLTNELSSFTINFYTYLILTVLCLPFIGKYVAWERIDTNFIFLVLLAGFLCALGTACTIKAVNIGELSVLGPINAYKSVIGLIAAFIFLKETPSFIAIIGMILIIIGSKYIFEADEKGFSINLIKRKDIQLRFLSLILTGTEAAILKKIILISSVEMCFIFWCFMGLFWTSIFVLIAKKNLELKSCKIFSILIFIAICLGLMQFSTNFVFERMNVGYALALFQLSSIVTVLLGYKFFREKNLIRKLIATFIMIFGSILIIFS